MQHTHVYTVFVLIWWLNEKKEKFNPELYNKMEIPIAASR